MGTLPRPFIAAAAARALPIVPSALAVAQPVPGLQVTTGGPSAANLAAWQANPGAGGAVTNRASIMQLFVATLGSVTKTILMTGDGFATNGMNDIVNGFPTLAGQVVDVMKVPHHGSMLTSAQAFFATVRAHYYFISSNRRHHLPTLPCLQWIVEGSAGLGPTIFVDESAIPVAQQLLASHPPAAWGNYQIFSTIPGQDVTISFTSIDGVLGTILPIPGLTVDPVVAAHAEPDPTGREPATQGA